MMTLFSSCWMTLLGNPVLLAQLSVTFRTENETHAQNRAHQCFMLPPSPPTAKPGDLRALREGLNSAILGQFTPKPA